MNLIKKHVQYLKDNPEGYWFKRKVYGWGWTPATWQGWLVTVVFVALLLTVVFNVDENATSKEVVSTLVLPVVILAAVLLGICYKTGEKPKWQWGFPKED